MRADDAAERGAVPGVAGEQPRTALRQRGVAAATVPPATGRRWWRLGVRSWWGIIPRGSASPAAARCGVGAGQKSRRSCHEARISRGISAAIKVRLLASRRRWRNRCAARRNRGRCQRSPPSRCRSRRGCGRRPRAGPGSAGCSTPRRSAGPGSRSRRRWCCPCVRSQSASTVSVSQGMKATPPVDLRIGVELRRDEAVEGRPAKLGALRLRAVRPKLTHRRRYMAARSTPRFTVCLVACSVSAPEVEALPDSALMSARKTSPTMSLTFMPTARCSSKA